MQDHMQKENSEGDSILLFKYVKEWCDLVRDQSHRGDDLKDEQELKRREGESVFGRGHSL